MNYHNIYFTNLLNKVRVIDLGTAITLSLMVSASLKSIAANNKWKENKLLELNHNVYFVEETLKTLLF